MKEIIFLVEELSAKALLESLLPRLLPDDTSSRVIPFEGKQDLEKQVVRRIRGYQNPAARFIVLRDQDSAPDCTALKQRLLAYCAESGKAKEQSERLSCAHCMHGTRNVLSRRPSRRRARARNQWTGQTSGHSQIPDS